MADGRADFLWQAQPLTNVDRLRARYAAQLHSSTAPWTTYLYLNTTKPPFDDADARRAVAHALDRTALAHGDGVLSGPVTCRHIPPDFPGYEGYCPFGLGGGQDGEWAGPDLAAADELLESSGTRGGRVVVVAWPDQAFQDVGKEVAELLRRLGYRASMVTDNEFDIASDPRNDWNIGAIGLSADYPTPSTFLTPIASCGSANNLTGLCDPQLDEHMERATEQQVTDPAAAADAWAAIDRAVVDAAAIIPFGNNERHEVVSSRVDNILVHPLSGALVSQLWVQ